MDSYDEILHWETCYSFWTKLIKAVKQIFRCYLIWTNRTVLNCMWCGQWSAWIQHGKCQCKSARNAYNLAKVPQGQDPNNFSTYYFWNCYCLNGQQLEYLTPIHYNWNAQSIFSQGHKKRYISHETYNEAIKNLIMFCMGRSDGPKTCYCA